MGNLAESIVVRGSVHEAEVLDSVDEKCNSCGHICSASVMTLSDIIVSAKERTCTNCGQKTTT